MALLDRDHLEHAGFRVMYYGELTPEISRRIARGLDLLLDGRLRRWHVHTGSGSVSVDLPAELDEAGATAAVRADPVYSSGWTKKSTVRLSDQPSGGNSWIRVLGAGGCVAIEQAPLAVQLDLLEAA